MRGKIERWRREGLNDAAANLERYLAGKGGIFSLSREQDVSSNTCGTGRRRIRGDSWKGHSWPPAQKARARSSCLI